ncbi:cytochrome ubiquinol oxidase subunit II [Coxiella endosymbiont of Amblyomma sculptum]|uniref:COX aromatic rich motif-containing protein n=1 Tax=Coxiella endosymbiont of Amblyomma sculptum TaxID=2487929 RepID=UPI00132E9748|nr:COX aromatic rich motif-containing protein [Coxiella endosymbiont of Amblyomma sculptum]QHG92733.1 cytochrome ubiquinol oxidase subunit II [Coxiella endosymbiont of Amblyomma sculptum]
MIGKSEKFCRHLKKFLFGAVLISSTAILTGCCTTKTGIFNPKGIITYEEKKLFLNALVLMSIVVVPVFVMSFAFIVRYCRTETEKHYKRTSGSEQGNCKDLNYQPNWNYSPLLEGVVWSVPMAIISVLGIMVWTTSHKLDPYRPLAGTGTGKSMIVQAIALPWKWLFIYPKQKIATLNYLEIAEGQPVKLTLTSDNVPMSAFFIPQLGSQIYTMAGMQTKLHLVATKSGTYEGFDSQYNGNGFSDMHFAVRVVNSNEFQSWCDKVRRSREKLTFPVYQNLIRPSIKVSVHCYSSVVPNLFSQVLTKYLQTKGNSTYR